MQITSHFWGKENEIDGYRLPDRTLGRRPAESWAGRPAPSTGLIQMSSVFGRTRLITDCIIQLFKFSYVGRQACIAASQKELVFHPVDPESSTFLAIAMNL